MHHNVSEAHLKRYLAEFDFRYNERSSRDVDDKTCAIKAVIPRGLGLVLRR